MCWWIYRIRSDCCYSGPLIFTIYGGGWQGLWLGCRLLIGQAVNVECSIARARLRLSGCQNWVAYVVRGAARSVARQ